MTPGARVAAAIDVLDQMRAGQPAEQALTRWARRSRFAGSKDRAAVRDLVFDVVRRRRSAAHYGGGSSSRALMIGLLHMQGADLEALFDGSGYGPAPLTAAERTFPAPPTEPATVADLPDWLVPLFEQSLTENWLETAQTLQTRAPTFLRVNAARGTAEAARQSLQHDSISAALHPTCATALIVEEGARRIRQSEAYRTGLVELQDAGSQMVVNVIPAAQRVLDFCAGGGGKALALAAQGDRDVHAHDAAPDRMKDLPERAARAGVPVHMLAPPDLKEAAPFDVVLCDAPCSGSGAWRRAPEGKWALTPDRLDELTRLQDSILAQASALVAPGGTLIYATCSVLRIENDARRAAFLDRHPAWQVAFEKRFDVGLLGDGFYTVQLQRKVMGA